jgi:hypothetical protein
MEFVARAVRVFILRADQHELIGRSLTPRANYLLVIRRKLKQGDGETPQEGRELVTQTN